MFLIRNYVPNWTTTPPAPTIAPTTAPIASTPRDPCGKYILSIVKEGGVKRGRRWGKSENGVQYGGKFPIY